MEASPRIANASYILTGAALIAALLLHLVPALVAGLMV